MDVAPFLSVSALMICGTYAITRTLLHAAKRTSVISSRRMDISGKLNASRSASRQDFDSKFRTAGACGGHIARQGFPREPAPHQLRIGKSRKLLVGGRSGVVVGASIYPNRNSAPDASYPAEEPRWFALSDRIGWQEVMCGHRRSIL